MKIIRGDLLEGDWDCAFHCANVHCVMGSGVALHLSRKWPIVSQVDDEFEENGHDRLGLFTKAMVEPGRFVYNLYGQVGVGNDGTVLGRNCHYEHLYNAMYRACEDVVSIGHRVRIGVPYKMGCDRAGGSWIIVDAMLADLEERFPVFFVVYQLEEDKNTKSQSSVSVSKFLFDDFHCVPYDPTPEQIEEYRNEKDHDKRIELAYEYQISQDDLYPEDLEDILLDVNESLK